ncbi:DUF4334 domain-containing protein [Spongiivirga sp. MCCC 1A20706]|uniref:DUF4334 domain-containing protein n=1 Tax=Spongiivirga sp. MCCC 1A20706 TaxID=3160963 RepID=UPI0039774DEB
MNKHEAISKFHEFALVNEVIDFDQLAEIFSNLAPLNTNEILGSWKGGFFKTGKLIDLTLRDYGIIKWVGKHYISENKVKALKYKFLGLTFSFPIIGRARIRHVEFRDKMSTAMIYNHLPIIDHFRRVDDSTLMGVMDFKGRIVLYFYLYRS